MFYVCPRVKFLNQILIEYYGTGEYPERVLLIYIDCDW
jgi:hypothetical protein